MNQATRTLLRNPQLRRKVVSIQQQQPAVVTQRLFAVVAQQEAVTKNDDTTTTVNFVKEAIKKMIVDRDQTIDFKPISTEDLERRFQSFQNHYYEAKSCIKDLNDATYNEFEEESKSACIAVDNAFSSYIDLLEDLQRAKDDQLTLYTNERLQNVEKLRLLRKDLEEKLQFYHNHQ